MSDRVYVGYAEEYDGEHIYELISDAFEKLGFGREDFVGKKVVIKPNLIMKKSPEYAATTHPVVINAICRVLSGCGVRPVIAESPSGAYTAQRMAAFYRACGINAAAEGLADLNFDVSTVPVNSGCETLHTFNIIKPIYDADVIIDAAKLKSHSLTKMTGAVKNLFGVVPGLEKFEMHARFPDEEVFSRAITDICEYLCKNKKVISVTDAVVCMEGNGPTGGRPRKVGQILVSDNPAASDAVAGDIIGFDGVVIDRTARQRGLYGGPENIVILGSEPKKVRGFTAPDSKKRGAVLLLKILSGKKLSKLFAPHPVIDPKKCVGCGECAAACPARTIAVETVKGGRRAVIDGRKCIRCFCCQEICPKTAVKTVRNPLVSVVDGIKRRR